MQKTSSYFGQSSTVGQSIYYSTKPKEFSIKQLLHLVCQCALMYMERSSLLKCLSLHTAAASCHPSYYCLSAIYFAMRRIFLPAHIALSLSFELQCIEVILCNV